MAQHWFEEKDATISVRAAEDEEGRIRITYLEVHGPVPQRWDIQTYRMLTAVGYAITTVDESAPRKEQLEQIIAICVRLNAPALRTVAAFYGKSVSSATRILRAESVKVPGNGFGRGRRTLTGPGY